MAVEKRSPMSVIDFYTANNRPGDRPARGPTVAVNGYVYGSRNHPNSAFASRSVDPNRPQNIRGIINTLDKAKFNQEKLRRQKQKYESFTVEPMMGRPVIDTPGIGRSQAVKLQGQGIRMATELREIYLDIGKTEFIDWLDSMGIDQSNGKECAQAIHEWCEKYIKLPR